MLVSEHFEMSKLIEVLSKNGSCIYIKSYDGGYTN
jgi:hypothetical protein